MNYIRLIEITNAQELVIIKLALNKENVEYRTLFEKTLQVADAYALGNNGAIIEVAENDFDKAKEILSELGIEIVYDVEEDRFEFINTIDKYTRNLPVLGRLQLAYRFLLLICLSFMIFMTAVLVNITRITKSELKGKRWCIEKITHRGKTLKPNTLQGITIYGFPESCQEEMSFIGTGRLSLPGFDTKEVGAWCNFKTEKILVISETDNFQEIYEGEYLVKTNYRGTLEFESDKTTIVISRNKFAWK